MPVFAQVVKLVDTPAWGAGAHKGRAGSSPVLGTRRVLQNSVNQKNCKTLFLLSYILVIVFDTTVCERTPWWRGLLPDYELPLSYNEITMGTDGETDVMLEYALQLIAEGKYLSEIDPFAEIEVPAEDTKFSLPEWIDVEVTGDKRYNNSQLCKKPYKEWKE